MILARAKSSVVMVGVQRDQVAQYTASKNRHSRIIKEAFVDPAPQHFHIRRRRSRLQESEELRGPRVARETVRTCAQGIQKSAPCSVLAGDADGVEAQQSVQCGLHEEPQLLERQSVSA